MGQKDVIVMSAKEWNRRRVIEDAAARKISYKHAARRLGLSNTNGSKKINKSVPFNLYL